MASAWGKSWGNSWGKAWGRTAAVAGAPGLVGWPVRIPQPKRKRTRRARERSDLILIATKP